MKKVLKKKTQKKAVAKAKTKTKTKIKTKAKANAKVSSAGLKKSSIKAKKSIKTKNSKSQPKASKTISQSKKLTQKVTEKVLRSSSAAQATKKFVVPKFIPLEDRVLVRPQGSSEKTPGGIIIPNMVEDKPNQGEVVAVGPGRRGKKGQLQFLDVKVGDKIIYSQYAGQKVLLGPEEYLILREEEVLAVQEK